MHVLLVDGLNIPYIPWPHHHWVRLSDLFPRDNLHRDCSPKHPDAVVLLGLHQNRDKAD